MSFDVLGIVGLIEDALQRYGWSVNREGSMGGRADLVAQHEGDVLLVEVKAPSRPVSFSQLAQLADYLQLVDSVDQIRSARGVLVTDGEVSASIKSYAERAGISIVPISSSPEDVGERVVSALAEGG